MKSEPIGARRSHPSGRRRTVLGLKDDVRITADHISGQTSRITDGGLPPMTPEERLTKVKNIAAQVRRHFGRQDREMGKRYYRVAYAILMGRHWSKLRIPRSTFFYARKKVEDFLMP